MRVASEPLPLAGSAPETDALATGVAHQLRNPVFAISATLAALDARLLAAPGAGEHLAVIRAELERLSRLADELSAYGAARRLAPGPVSVGELVDGAVSACRALAESREQVVVARVEDGAAPVRLDRTRVAAAVRGVLEHALRRSPAGAIVTLEARAAGESLVLAIRDAGRPLEPTAIARAFEPFSGREPGETGLGLALARRVAEAHGGAASAESGADGAGVRVTLRIPGAPPARGRAP